ncbi:hypothetical protein C8D76_103131 [Pasteurella langaaensis DSM 22999]|uniref:Uncharacterized protein n=1 Tax=Alitibacter langaaensis DSM 22999 TaxID=1122935 RepID=A0A2U0TAF8_9PAST|nr:hypothetical protein [Pasteurella langaaensis]PVX40558.1 hypothetical protein C8D76_103131 [Pasteurella langaaensis DSM 22999]
MLLYLLCSLGWVFGYWVVNKHQQNNLNAFEVIMLLVVWCVGIISFWQVVK